jgi:IS30 family transposase
MSYTHLTPSERGQLQALRAEGKSMRYIAKTIERDPSTISKELQRNSTRNGYDAQHAQQLYRERREECRPATKLDHRPLWAYVIDKLGDGWTPEQIAGRLPLEYPDDLRMRISYETIYHTIYTNKRFHFLRV